VHARGLAGLVLLALLSRLTGSALLATARATLSAVTDAAAGGALDALRVEDIPALGDAAALGPALASKASAPATRARLFASLLGAIAALPRPAGVVALPWLADADGDAPQGAQHVALMRGLYELAHTGAAPPALGAALARAQLAAVGQDALLFLAGVWTAAPGPSAGAAHAALCHALAFLTAHARARAAVDFQVLLAALAAPERAVREAAAECVGAMQSIVDGVDGPERVYAMDGVYGAASG
jgi:U3 small nucleolar RNA-associated protein 10